MNQSDITNTTSGETSVAINSNYVFALDRVKKLSAAIYAVTDLINPTDPLRQNLRSKSLSLLTDIFQLHRNTRSKLQLKDLVKSSLEEMVALIELASFAKFVSEMNSLVLITEYKKLLSVVLETDDIKISLAETKLPQTSELPKIEERVFLKRTDSLIENKMSFIPSDEFKKTSEVMVASSAPQNKNTNRQVVSKIKKYYRDSNHAPIAKEKSKKDEKNDRKEAILKLFEKGVLLTIKDIATKVQGYSEKTVQRELNDLVEMGKLTRVGEKRWSKYTLK